jgi:predicted Mrr-cat superfamily restriction endonuclease
MQQAELQIKAEEVKRKAAKDQADIALAQARLQVEQERIAVEARKEQQRLSAKAIETDKKLKADVLTKMRTQ